VAIVTFTAVGGEQVIYSFTGDADGEYPDTQLTIDSAGNLYGTTVQGGRYSSGTVFQLKHSASGWTHTVLYDFRGGADGGEPYKGVTLDAHGNLYGTAVVGGTFTGPCIEQGCGVVYRLTNTGGRWSQTVIHSFTGTGGDGYGPGSPVALDRLGNVYGTTPTGGADGLGIVYQLVAGGTGNFTEKIIHTFTGGSDGGTGSAAAPIVTLGGQVIGVATVGGANGAGTIYQLTPTQSGEWAVTTLYAFKGEPDSGFPYGGVVIDRTGNIYGTTYYAGANDLGTIYELSRRSGVWTESSLYSFRGGTDGSGPISTLITAADGTLYGTTSEGGATCSCGTIFQLTQAGGKPVYSVVYRFLGAPDGGFAYNGLVAGVGGNVLYGTTVHGGTSDDGAVYEFVP
jgi:uncharacterized repeat protein (TIGR03803 family)